MFWKRGIEIKTFVEHKALGKVHLDFRSRMLIFWGNRKKSVLNLRFTASLVFHLLMGYPELCMNDWRKQ